MRLRIAIQKSGRLSDDSLELLKKCGITFSHSKDRLFCFGRTFPIDLLFVRDDDIPQLLAENACQLAIVGQDTVREFELCGEDATAIRQLRELQFGVCRLAIAVPESFPWSGLASLNGRRIATSFPGITNSYLERNSIRATCVRLSGSVEVAPQLGTADAICDLVSTGATLRANQLLEVETIFDVRAALYRNVREFPGDGEALVNKLLTRIDGVQQAAESKYVMLHAPRSAVARITSLLPGAESPTVLPLEGHEDRVALHAVCREGVFWDHIEELRAAGASAVLVLPVEKMLA